jgi:hypothetical protein
MRNYFWEYGVPIEYVQSQNVEMLTYISHATPSHGSSDTRSAFAVLTLRQSSKIAGYVAGFKAIPYY